MFWWGEILLLLKMYLGMARFSDCWGEKLSQQNWNGAINVVCWTNVDFSEELYIKAKERTEMASDSEAAAAEAGGAKTVKNGQKSHLFITSYINFTGCVSPFCKMHHYKSLFQSLPSWTLTNGLKNHSDISDSSWKWLHFYLLLKLNNGTFCRKTCFMSLN